jgi:hypothetical protein
MAASLVIADERGSYTTVRHPHNGYYAGDFGSGPAVLAHTGARVAAEEIATTWDASRWLGPWTR